MTNEPNNHDDLIPRLDPTKLTQEAIANARDEWRRDIASLKELLIDRDRLREEYRKEMKTDAEKDARATGTAITEQLAQLSARVDDLKERIIAVEQQKASLAAAEERLQRLEYGSPSSGV